MSKSYYLDYYRELCPSEEGWVIEQLAEERIAADKKEKELCDLLMQIREDYNHAWPNEDSGTHDHRTTIFNRITAVLAK